MSTGSNIQLDHVLSDVFGKASSALVEHLLSQSVPTTFGVKPFLTKGIKASIEDIQKAVNGSFCPEQAKKLRIIRSHIDSPAICKDNLQSLILSLAEKYRDQINLVCGVPGIHVFSAIGVIAEIGVDMSVFQTSKHLCS